ncbi:UPF0182 family protein [Rhodococcus sp. IEGM 1341]|uniref:UPF0182 family protein n=1 Tax=Rhodococcus sp. IEGM 1341 TaxID=3047090 RepID=UPI0024B85FCE|nr:UPF0182 family protein [Rhodococcus sp. IEGM 1341]MDI9925113.1 UPF0182 family protein [Rhodococcus sp. IEGM 1341]
MGMRPPTGMPSLSRRSRILLVLALVAAGLLLIGPRLIDVYTNWLWFGEVDFRGVYTTTLLTRLVIFFVVALVVGLIVFAALAVAYRNRPVFVPVAGPNDPIARYRTTVMSRLRLFGIGIPVVFGFLSGMIAQTNWATVQLFIHGGDFGITDPQFNLDVGFYSFDLPFYRFILNWLFVAILVAFFANLVTQYVFGGIRLAGREGALTRAARIQLAVLAGTFVLLKAIAYWFDRYTLLSSSRKEPTFTGASFTDINAVLPAKLILLAIAVICAIAFFAAIFLRDLRIPALATALLVLSSILIGAVWPLVMEQFSVRPNAADKESTYIERNIAATRDAYGLNDDVVTYRDYSGEAALSPGEVASESATMSNIRLLDPNILAPTFTQQRQIRNFYGFPDTLAVDRYPDADGNLRDYVVAAREISPQTLDANQRDWINRHTVFTHGNGFVAAPANSVDEAVADESSGGRGGYPNYQVNWIENDSEGTIRKDGPGDLDQPRIYFGPVIANSDADYSIVGSTGEPREYDTDSKSYTYTGAAGVDVGNFFNRLVFASKYAERNILFSSVIGDESKILFNRDPRDRVQKVAPWLTTDGSTYPAIVEGKLVWIIDGYTTLDNFPYAQRMSLEDATADSIESTTTRALPSREVSYIRNSVKATVDAYDGTVKLYEQDENDPVLKAWEGVFPGTVIPKDQVSDELRDHFRYPEDLFKVQRELLTKYHVNDPREFFTNNAFWEVPTDPTAENTAAKQPPYYVVASDISNQENQASFQLTSALVGYRREVLGAYVSADSDPENYGKITVLRLPTDTSTQGPNQVQNQMTTTTDVSESLGIVRRENTVEFGNLLTLPVGDGGLIYVEPVYASRTNEASAYPQLIRVLVSYEGRVGYAATLPEAIEQVFGAGAGRTVTAPGETDGTTQPGAVPETAPSDGGAPAATPAPATGGSTTRDAAVSELNSALAAVRTAQQSGNLAELGTALEDLQTAVDTYNQAGN